MKRSNSSAMLEHFEQSIKDCEQLYRESGQVCVEQYPRSLPHTPDQFLARMIQLHRGLLIKIYATVAAADGRWTRPEQQIAATLFQHLWGTKMKGQTLRDAATRVFGDARKLTWANLVRPFSSLDPLRDQVGDLETIVMRVGNLIAKIDGEVSSEESKVLRQMQSEIDQCLHRRSLQSPTEATAGNSTTTMQQQAVQKETRPPASRPQKPAAPPVVQRPSAAGKKPPAEKMQTSPDQLAEAISQLNELVGLRSVKQEVRTLTNFLKIQQHRRQAGLPTTDTSLHMVFSGNPGTGKTTVARIIGRIYGALGILKKGHLVETDRSGLVAQFAGQTAHRTNQQIDEALDGVLFIDEAYSLSAEGSEDPYGQEAVQILLKRMEDERHRLVVILAGYPDPMQRLLSSNPGLTSRFNTHLQFEDYQPRELYRIFVQMCRQNHYELPRSSRQRLLQALDWLYRHRDEHFGNGRMVRNEFEKAIRRLANRIADAVPLTPEMLTTMKPEDLQFSDVPSPKPPSRTTKKRARD